MLNGTWNISALPDKPDWDGAANGATYASYWDAVGYRKYPNVNDSTPSYDVGLVKTNEHMRWFTKDLIDNGVESEDCNTINGDTWTWNQFCEVSKPLYEKYKNISDDHTETALGWDDFRTKMNSGVKEASDNPLWEKALKGRLVTNGFVPDSPGMEVCKLPCRADQIRLANDGNWVDPNGVCADVPVGYYCGKQPGSDDFDWFRRSSLDDECEGISLDTQVANASFLNWNVSNITSMDRTFKKY